MKLTEIVEQESETFLRRNDDWLRKHMDEEDCKELISEVVKRLNRLAYRVRHEAIED